MLDTNVLSVMMTPTAAPTVMAWLDTLPVELIFTNAVSMFEVWQGLWVLPMGQRRLTLESRFVQLIEAGLGRRVLRFDEASARESASIYCRMRSVGAGIETRDLFIAGIVATHGATLVTRNPRHFEHAGVPIVNPWEVAA